MRCIVMDDEPLAREAVLSFLKEIPDMEVVGVFGNAAAGAAFLDTGEADLLLLDINMPGISGIAFARKLAGYNALVIFITAYGEYALESYEVDAIDYLVKPLRKDRFAKAIEKAKNYHELLLHKDPLPVMENAHAADSGYFFLKADRKVFRVLYKEVLFIEGLKDYVVLHTKEQKIITAMNIKTIYAQLPHSIFFRVSKSYIINVDHISSLDNNSVQIGTFDIPIGNAYRGLFLENLVERKMIKR